jgi:hypothetical protein
VAEDFDDTALAESWAQPRAPFGIGCHA